MCLPQEQQGTGVALTLSWGPRVMANGRPPSAHTHDQHGRDPYVQGGKKSGQETFVGRLGGGTKDELNLL